MNRLIDLILDPDPLRACAAVDALGLLGFRTSDAIMAAYPRAETSRQRGDFLQIMSHITPSWNFDALTFLERIARDDPDEVIRLEAEYVRGYLMGDDEDDEDW